MRRVCFQIDEETYERAQAAAKADRRRLANWLALTVERALKDEPSESTGQSARPALFQRR